MGEIAEDLADGTRCSDCGQYFRDPDDPQTIYTHGYPVICKDCYREYSKREKRQCELPVATADTI